MLTCICIDWCKSLFHEILFLYFLDESKMKNGKKINYSPYQMTQLVHGRLA